MSMIEGHYDDGGGGDNYGDNGDDNGNGYSDKSMVMVVMI